MTPDDRQQLTDWLDLLYSEHPQDEYLNLFAINGAGDQVIEWATVADRHLLADIVAEDLHGTHNVWWGVGTRRDVVEGRGTRDDVVTIPGLWLDVDYHHDQAHKRKPSQLPNPTPEAAAAILAEFPLRPSAVVDTGYGLHLYWLFTEPQDAADVADLSRAWHNTWDARFVQAGYNLDNVSNLDRVLRLPGTINIKVDGLAPTVAAHYKDTPVTYDLDDLEPYLLAEPVDHGRMDQLRQHDGADTPGNRYNDVTPCSEVLLRHGWTPMPDRAPPGQQHWRRPGKDTAGKSGTTYPDGSFNCHSSADDKLEQDRWYDAFGLMATLDHGGDHSTAASAVLNAESDAWLLEAAESSTHSHDLLEEIPRTVAPAAASSPDSATQSGETGAESAPPVEGQPRPLIVRRHPPAFPVHVLPGIVGTYTTAISDALKTPLAVPGQKALACLSAAGNESGATIHIGGGWIEPCNLYLVLAMRTGGGKSPTISRLIKGLESTADRVGARSSMVRAEAESKARVLDKALSIEEQRAAKAKDPTEQGAAMDEAVRIIGQRVEVDIPEVRKFWSDDFTPEGMVRILAGNRGKLNAISSEGDLLESLDRYANPGKAPALKNLLIGWDAGRLIVDRADGRELIVDNARAVISLAMQPIVAHRIYRNAEYAGRGLTQRFMPAEPYFVPGYADRTVLNAPPPHLAPEWEQLLERIAKADTQEFRLDPDAQRTFLAWHQSLEVKQRPGGEYEGRITDHIPKLVSSTARAAVLFHLAIEMEGGRVPAPDIGVATVQSAIELGQYWLAHIVNLCGTAEEADVTLAVELVQWWCRTKRNGDERATETYTLRDITRTGPRSPGGKAHKAEDVEAALLELVVAGWVAPAGTTASGVAKWALQCSDTTLLVQTVVDASRHLATPPSVPEPTRHPRDTDHPEREATADSGEVSRQSRVALKGQNDNSLSLPVVSRDYGIV